MLRRPIDLEIHDSVVADRSELIVASSGTEPASARSRLQGPFHARARLPRPPWRPLTQADWHRPESSAGSPGCCITLLDLGENVLSPFRRLGFHHACSPADLWLLNDSIDARMAVEGLLDAVSRLVTGSPSRVSRVIPRLPGLDGVTVDCDADGHYIGLHVDSWERRPLELRHLSERRLCVNVGARDRFFLFVNVDLVDAFEALSLTEGEQVSATDLARSFLEAFPNHPVLRLRVRPGQAYLAPTENVIHDASTEGQIRLDLSVVMSGHFAASNKESSNVDILAESAVGRTMGRGGFPDDARRGDSSFCDGRAGGWAP